MPLPVLKVSTCVRSVFERRSSVASLVETFFALSFQVDDFAIDQRQVSIVAGFTEGLWLADGYVNKEFFKSE